MLKRFKKQTLGKDKEYTGISFDDTPLYLRHPSVKQYEFSFSTTWNFIVA